MAEPQPNVTQPAPVRWREGVLGRRDVAALLASAALVLLLYLWLSAREALHVFAGEHQIVRTCFRRDVHSAHPRPGDKLQTLDTAHMHHVQRLLRQDDRSLPGFIDLLKSETPRSDSTRIV